MPHDHTSPTHAHRSHTPTQRHTLLQRGAWHRLVWAVALSGLLWWALASATGQGL
jgi:hypothetical protein